MEKLYNDLMQLVEPGKFTKFFFKDFVTPFGTNVRVFSYNYAQYEDWLKPNALECRGIMFKMVDGKPTEILSRPMEKFFNLNETPFTMNLDLNEIDHFMTKEDGSLISTYIDGGTLRTKSKTSIFSDQAIEAHQVLLDVNYADLNARCLELGQQGYTCNFEYVSPTNRIVLSYDVKTLILLNVRHNETGEYIEFDEIRKDPVLRKYLVEGFVPDSLDPETMVEEIKSMPDIEGYIFVMNNGLRFKLKTHWYSALHRVKDTLNNHKALFETVVYNGSDDMKSLFDDPQSKAKIELFEVTFLGYLNNACEALGQFYDSHRGVTRKEYAIASQLYFRDLDRFELFSISMLMFEGRTSKETMVDQVNEVFLKVCEKHVPPEYINVKVNEE